MSDMPWLENLLGEKLCLHLNEDTVMFFHLFVMFILTLVPVIVIEIYSFYCVKFGLP